MTLASLGRRHARSYGLQWCLQESIRCPIPAGRAVASHSVLSHVSVHNYILRQRRSSMDTRRPSRSGILARLRPGTNILMVVLVGILVMEIRRASASVSSVSLATTCRILRQPMPPILPVGNDSLAGLLFRFSLSVGGSLTLLLYVLLGPVSE